jgi:hypothetical protein
MLNRRILLSTVLIAASAAICCAQRPSPAAETSTTIAGKKITIKYSAPSVRGRKIFGEDGIIKGDSTYPVWRAGANEATSLETAGELTIGDLKVPAGNYTLFVLLDKAGWKLIVNKQTGQGGLDYDEKQDLGRVAMKMAKTPTLVETYKMTLAPAGGNKGRLTLEWENTSASVDFSVK